MAKAKKDNLTEAQQKAAAFLTRTKPNLDAWRTAREAADAKAEAEAIAKIKVGDVMPDGTIYAGISPLTKEPMFTLPAQESLMMTFNEASKRASTLDAHGHKDWRIPTKEELGRMFGSRVAIGGFNLSGANPEGMYLSSSESDFDVMRCVDFKTGGLGNVPKGSYPARYPIPVRFVRSGPVSAL